MIINHLEKLFVTNDAATIIKELDVIHPAAKMAVLASQAQEQEVNHDETFFYKFFLRLVMELILLLYLLVLYQKMRKVCSEKVYIQVKLLMVILKQFKKHLKYLKVFLLLLLNKSLLLLFQNSKYFNQKILEMLMK